MANYELVAGDGGSVIRVTIKDSVTDVPVDLTGKTAQLRFSLNGGSTIEKSMTLLDQVSNTGQVQYLVLDSDVTEGGTIAGEVRLQDGLSDQLTTVDTFHLAVKEPLA